MGKVNLVPRALSGVLALTALWTVLPVAATPISDSVNPANTLITAGSTPAPCLSGLTCTTSALTFVHDITDDGFKVGLDLISSATITIHLMEQVVTGPNHEKFRYDIGFDPQVFACGAGNCVPNSGVTNTITLDAVALADLAADGKISVTVTSLAGNFLFADSLLTAQVTGSASRLASNVPEPASLPLLATGLVVLGWRFRRKD